MSKPYREYTEQDIYNLKKENEELKRLIAKQKNAKIQLSKLKDKEYKEFCDMKQCLYEIEEIIIKRQKEHYCYCDECSPFKEILQKIKEVKENERN